MKVKLLKKVRNRFTIEKVEKIASNASWFYSESATKFGLPFYVCKDSGFDLNAKSFNSFDDARDYLMSQISIIYHEEFRHTESIVKKVWRFNK